VAFFSMRGAAVLQCDFSAMISPAMYRRWVLPALEEEAEIVKHAYYHWDGVVALKHRREILSSRGFHTVGFLPGEGHGPQIDYLDLFKECQAAGKGVHVGGPLAECQAMHRQLRPDKTIYTVFVGTPAEGEAALEWFRRNT
jgi:5-methyltetrahydrofolate--homocysteine methyltransferase